MQVVAFQTPKEPSPRNFGQKGKSPFLNDTVPEPFSFWEIVSYQKLHQLYQNSQKIPKFQRVLNPGTALKGV